MPRPLAKRPDVSIIIPFFRDEEYLRRTLLSVVNQKHSNFECLLINDMSPDASPSIAAEFARKDRRFQVIHHKANAGLSAARNTGIAAARGDYLQFLDADDMLATDAISTRLAVAQRFKDNPEVAGSYCGNAIVDHLFGHIRPSAKDDTATVIDFFTSRGACPFTVHQPLVRTDLVKAAGGFNEAWSTAEDHELWYRLLRNGYCFVPSNRISTYYRLKPGTSMSTTTALQHLANSAAIQAEARQSMPPSIILPNAPFPYLKGWGYYEEAWSIAARLFSFGAMAGEGGVAAAVKAYLPEDTHHVIDRHLSVFAHINSGKSRAAGEIPSSAPRNAWSYFSRSMKDLSTETELCVPQSQAPRHTVGPQPVDVIFLPHKDYHVETIKTFALALERAGITYAIVDFARKYRDEGAGRRARELGLPVHSSSALDLGIIEPSFLISFNDWDPVVRGYFSKYSGRGVKSLAIVEGVQDYHDADTGRPRHAYQTADYVLVPGPHDLKYFTNRRSTTAVGGVANVERYWLRDFTLPSPRRAVVNCNFSYNVLTEARDGWLAEIREATSAADIEMIVSQHPGDKGDLSAYTVTDRSIYAEIEASNILISRFSTCILEALAMGRRVIYHNPHGEKVDKFFEENAPFRVTRSKQELIEELRRLANDTSDYRPAVADYLAWHANVDPSRQHAVVAENVGNEVVRLFRQATR